MYCTQTPLLSIRKKKPHRSPLRLQPRALVQGPRWHRALPPTRCLIFPFPLNLTEPHPRKTPWGPFSLQFCFSCSVCGSAYPQSSLSRWPQIGPFVFLCLAKKQKQRKLVKIKSFFPHLGTALLALNSHYILEVQNWISCTCMMSYFSGSKKKMRFGHCGKTHKN